MRIFKIKATGARDAFYKIFFVQKDILGLRGSALKILADLAYFHWRYKDMPDSKLEEFILSYDTRRFIMEKWGMSGQVLSNELYYLRKKGILNGKLLNEKFRIDPSDFSEILFKIEIEDEQDKKSIYGRS